PRVEAAALLPVKAALLTQVFPVLRRVEVIAEAPAPLDEVRDLQELRSRAFAAARELLSRLAERRPLVLMLDDMQWSDTDRLTLLRDIMRPPEPPALLLLVAIRESHDDPKDTAQLEMPGDVHHLHLSRLPQKYARRLASRVLAQLSVPDERLAMAIAEEAG